MPFLLVPSVTTHSYPSAQRICPNLPVSDLPILVEAAQPVDELLLPAFSGLDRLERPFPNHTDYTPSIPAFALTSMFCGCRSAVIHYKPFFRRECVIAWMELERLRKQLKILFAPVFAGEGLPEKRESLVRPARAMLGDARIRLGEMLRQDLVWRVVGQIKEGIRECPRALLQDCIARLRDLVVRVWH